MYLAAEPKPGVWSVMHKSLSIQHGHGEHGHHGGDHTVHTHASALGLGLFLTLVLALQLQLLLILGCTHGLFSPLVVFQKLMPGQDPDIVALYRKSPPLSRGKRRNSRRISTLFTNYPAISAILLLRIKKKLRQNCRSSHCSEDSPIYSPALAV